LSGRRTEADGLLLNIRVTPNSGANTVGAMQTRSDGRRYLSVRVTAPPSEGAANDAVCALIAAKAGLRRKEVTIASGAQAREKRLKLTGDPIALRAWIEQLELADDRRHH